VIENINYLIDLVGGNSNALTILTLFIGLFFSFYLYFKTFFRLVFTTERIFKDRNEQIEYTTRILFYNNGRKTLTKNEINQLVIKYSKDISSIRLLQNNENIKLHKKRKKINIDIDYLDSSKFFVVEIEHNGYVEVDGRISETGEILRTEPTYWMVINIVFMIYLVYSLFNTFYPLKDNNINDNSDLLNFLLIIGVFITIRFIHSLLFIPDRITGKYLHPKDKFNREFKNTF
jgi:hypothetical protein